MSHTNPYRPWVARFAELLQNDAVVAIDPATLPSPAAGSADAPRALIFSPHPDDEAIIGGLPRR